MFNVFRWRAHSVHLSSGWIGFYFVSSALVPFPFSGCVEIVILCPYMYRICERASERQSQRARERERDYIIRLNGSVWTNKQHQPRVHPAYNCIYIVLIFGGDYSPPQQITGTRLNWLSFDHTLERRSLSRTWVCASSSPVRSSYLVIDMYSYSVCRVHCNTS